MPPRTKRNGGTSSFVELIYEQYNKFHKYRSILADDRSRLKVLRNHGLLDPGYPRGHIIGVVETMSQIYEVFLFHLP